MTLAVPAYLFGRSNLRETLVYTLLGFIFASLPTGLIGLPAFLVLQHFRLVNFCTTLLGGLLAGLGGAILLRAPAAFNPGDLPPTLSAGAMAACVFWAMWRRRAAK